MVTGRDLRAARTAAGIGLDRLAGQIGRHKSHLSRVERGDREVTPALLRDYERALGVSIPAGSRSLSSASPAPGGALGGLLGALSELPNEPRCERVSLDDLRSSVAVAKRAYQACRYQSLLPWLPDLLQSTHVVRQGVGSARRAEVDVLTATAYQVAGSVALKFDDPVVAGLASSRCHSAALESGDPLAVAASARLVCHLLSSGGHHDRAATYAEHAVLRFRAIADQLDARSASVCGALLLRGAVAAARAEARDRAETLLTEAQMMTRYLPTDGNAYWTGFGPTNVLVHRVHVAVSLGDAGTALRHASAIDMARLELPERRAALQLDLARAYTMWGRAGPAYAALIDAQGIAPEELRARPATKRLIADLTHLASGSLRNDVRRLREWIGVGS